MCVMYACVYMMFVCVCLCGVYEYAVCEVSGVYMMCV